jgi:hypoxanthine phosphoribosyltransferase
MSKNITSIDLTGQPLRYTANHFTNDYAGGSFKIRPDYLPLVKGIMIPNYELLEREKELLGEIERDYRGEDPLFIPILKGAVRFSQDMFRFAKHLDPEFEFMPASSYGDRLESGKVKIDLKAILRLMEKLKDRHRPVIIVEDIVDTGNTLNHITYVLNNLDDVIDSQPEFADFERTGTYTPSSVSICTLLDKRVKMDPRFADLPVDYIGFTIADEWVFGYGLDAWDDKVRMLDHLCVLSDHYRDESKLEQFFKELDKKNKEKK